MADYLTPQEFQQNYLVSDFSQGQQENSAWSDMSAMYRANNILGAGVLEEAYSGDDLSDWTLASDEEVIANGFDPYEWIKTTNLEEERQRLMIPYIANAQSPAEARRTMALYRQKERDRQQIANMPITRQLWTGAVAGLLDPVTIASMVMIPGVGAGASLARIAGSVAGIAAGEQIITEGVLHQLQPMRTFNESFTNVVAGTAIAGALGYGIGGIARIRSSNDPEVLSKVKEYETDLETHLDNSRFAPVEDDSLVHGTNLALDDVRISESLDEIRTRAKTEGLDEEILIAERRAEYEAIDAETDVFAKRGLVRGVNPITNMQTSPSAAIRSLGTRVFGGGLASKANVQGKVGDAIPAPVEARINASSRYVDRVLLIMDKYRKDFYGSLPKAIIRDTTFGDLDRHMARLMRTDGEEIIEATGQARPLREWEKKAYKDLNENWAQMEDYRFRQGYHQDVLTRADWTPDRLAALREETLANFPAKLAKAEKDWEASANYKGEVAELRDARVKKLEAERDLQLRMIDELIPLSKRVFDNGDRNAAYKLVRMLTGDKNYLPQSWSRQKVQNIGEEEFVRRGLPSKKAKLERLSRNEDILPSMREIYRRQLDEWNEKAETQLLRESYRTISGDNTGGVAGVDAGVLNPDASKVPSALQGRHLMFEQDDPLMGELLDQSYSGILTKNNMQVAPYLELKNAGVLPGTQRHADMIKQVMDEIEVRTHGLPRKKAEKIRKRILADLEDFEHSIRVIQHKANEGSQEFRRIASLLKDLQIMRGLGSVLFMSMPDVTMGAMKNGGLKGYGKMFAPTMRRMRSFAAEISQEDAAFMANIHDIASATTMHKISDDIDDGFERGAVGSVFNKMTAGFMKLTGLPYANQFNKVSTVKTAENRLIEAALGKAKLDKADRLWLAQHGWSEEKLAQVADLYRRHGTMHGNVHVFDYGGVRRAYEDELASGAQPTLASDMNLLDEFGAFANWISDKNIVTPGATDLPKFITKDTTMQLVTQFKSFPFASVDKTLNPIIQNLAMGNYKVLEGIFSSWAAAIGGWYLYMASRGRLDEVDDMSSTQIAYEGLMRSGLLPLLDLGIMSTQKLTANFGGLGDAVGLSPVSRYYSRNAITELLGPTFGFVTEAYGAVGNAFYKTANGEDFTHQDWSKIARLIPYNNLFYLRAALEYGLKD